LKLALRLVNSMNGYATNRRWDNGEDS